MGTGRTTLPLLGPIQHRLELSHDAPAFARDPQFVQRFLGLIDCGLGWFSPEVRGIERVPTDGPALIVGNHCGAPIMPDAVALFAALVRRRGLDRPTYSLAYDLLFAMPGIGPALRRAGMLPADPHTAERALGDGAAVLVYPGGDWEACRPWTERRRVEFHDHAGFARLALRAGVPVIPAVANGSHEAVMILTRGDRLAHTVGLDRLRINVLPFALGMPFGLTPLPVTGLPLPTKVTVDVLEPLDWSRWYGHDDDPTIVRRCYDQTVATLQGGLDRLYAERPHPLLSRLHAPGPHPARQ
jgi:1-acyl-sn-glycerol-3-phosphate acyltransferase